MTLAEYQEKLAAIWRDDWTFLSDGEQRRPLVDFINQTEIAKNIGIPREAKLTQGPQYTYSYETNSYSPIRQMEVIDIINSTNWRCDGKPLIQPAVTPKRGWRTDARGAVVQDRITLFELTFTCHNARESFLVLNTPIKRADDANRVSEDLFKIRPFAPKNEQLVGAIMPPTSRAIPIDSPISHIDAQRVIEL